MKIADYGKAITSYIESPTTAQKLQAKDKAQTLNRTLLADGSEDIVEPSKSMQVDTTTKGLDLFTIDNFKDKAEIYVGALYNGALPTADIKSALNKFTQKGIDDGTFTADDAIKVVQDLKFQFQDRAQKQRLRDVIIEGTGTVEREEFGEGTKTKLVEFIEKFKSQNNRPPTIMEVADGAKSSTASIRKYLEEGVDFVKTDLSEVGKKGGLAGAEGKKTGVTKLDKKAYKELQDLRIKGVSFQVDTGVGGSKGVRVTIQDPNVSKAFFGDKKTLSFTADAKGIEQAKNLVKQIAISEVYKDNVLPFQTDEYKLKIKRLKAKQYKLKDPYGVYKALQEYKTKVFPGNLSKEIQIQHGDAKFTTQTLSRMGLIDAAANISPAVEKAERLRNNALKTALATLDNPDASVAAKKAAAEKYNSIAKGLRGQLKGTEGQGLVNFQLLEVDDSGNYKKLKDISFDPKRGLVDSDLDLSKITKEEAEELIAKGKKKLDLEEKDKCYIFFNSFKNVITQIPRSELIVPATSLSDLQSSRDKNTDNEETHSYEFEPEEDEILNELLPKNISVQILKAFLENAASEQGSRMTAMDNATRNAGELVDKLTINYNRSRQASITKELIEIISGAESL